MKFHKNYKKWNLTIFIIYLLISVYTFASIYTYVSEKAMAPHSSTFA